MIIESIDEISEIISKKVDDDLVMECKATLGYKINKRELIEAVNKATAKKPFVGKDKVYKYKVFMCPVCDFVFADYENTIERIKENRILENELYNYCKICGQKIDWNIIKKEEVE